MSQLAARVNRLADVNARKMMIEVKVCKYLSEFQREEAKKKTREHEKYMTEFYLRMMNHSNSTHPNPLVYNQL